MISCAHSHTHVSLTRTNGVCVQFTVSVGTTSMSSDSTISVSSVSTLSVASQGAGLNLSGASGVTVNSPVVSGFEAEQRIIKCADVCECV